MTGVRLSAWLAAAVLAVAVLAACMPGASADTQAPETQASETQAQHLPVHAQPLVIETKGGPQPFRIEVAKTPATMKRGLMFRRDLPSDQGMLFIFGRDQPLSFWMKNTYLSLDMIFIRTGGEIVAIVPDTQPMSTTPIAPAPLAAYVLEVNAGTARRLGLSVGDHAHHPLIKSSADAGAGTPR